jgi:ribosomal-protein-alanine N-acetyltransferase
MVLFHVVSPAMRAKYNSNMSESPPRIRDFQNEDLEELFKIDQICFPEDIAFSRTELLFYLNTSKRIARVVEEGSGKILGFVLARIENRWRAHVLTLDVIPEVRRQRIGTVLMTDLHNELKRQKIRASILEVSANNLPAQRLYMALQYRYLGTLSGYYRGREDAYRMARLIYSPNQ